MAIDRDHAGGTRRRDRRSAQGILRGMNWLAILALVASPLFAQTRIASDFEIARMKQQIATSHDFLSQLSGHLNLGDLYLTRSETATARAEYAKALAIAGNEALDARKASDITRYATAVAYSA